MDGAAVNLSPTRSPNFTLGIAGDSDFDVGWAMGVETGTTPGSGRLVFQDAGSPDASFTDVSCVALSLAWTTRLSICEIFGTVPTGSDLLDASLDVSVLISPSTYLKGGASGGLHFPSL